MSRIPVTPAAAAVSAALAIGGCGSSANPTASVKSPGVEVSDAMTPKANGNSEQGVTTGARMEPK